MPVEKHGKGSKYQQWEQISSMIVFLLKLSLLKSWFQKKFLVQGIKF